MGRLMEEGNDGHFTGRDAQSVRLPHLANTVVGSMHIVDGSQSGLTMPPRHSVGTHQENELTRSSE